MSFLKKRIIPSMLYQNERLVKGINYNAYKDAGSPITTAKVYNAQGADEIMFVDIEAKKNNKTISTDLIKEISSVINIPLTVGGNINHHEIAIKCITKGSDKLLITSLFFEDLKEVEKITYHLGNQAVVFGLDVITEENEIYLFDHVSKKPNKKYQFKDLIELCKSIEFGELRLMNVNAEGTRKGMSIDLFKKFANELKNPIIYEGGIGNIKHINEALNSGCNSISLGAALIFNDLNIFKIKYGLKAYNQNVRVI